MYAISDYRLTNKLFFFHLSSPPSFFVILFTANVRIRRLPSRDAFLSFTRRNDNYGRNRRTTYRTFKNTRTISIRRSTDFIPKRVVSCSVPLYVKQRMDCSLYILSLINPYRTQCLPLYYINVHHRLTWLTHPLSLTCRIIISLFFKPVLPFFN